MRVLIISNMYPTMDQPSYGVFVKNFLQDIEAQGAEVQLCAIHGRARNKFVKLFKYVRFITEALYKLLFSRYDVIYMHYIAHSLIPLILLRPVLSRPYILNAHGEDVILNKRVERIIEFIGRRTIRKASMIVVPSVHFQEIMKKRYPEGRVVVSPSGGINTQIFYSDSSLRPENDLFSIGYVSRIDEGKGWDTLLNAIFKLKSKHSNIELVMIGLGSQVDLLKEKIDTLKLNDSVRYLGAKNQKELGAYFRSFDVFVFPTCLNESLGLVGIESMACGTPVIGSDIPSIKTYLENNVNGLLFQAGNVDDLANKIDDFIRMSEEEKIKMRTVCKEKGMQYSSVLVAEALFREISNVYESSKKRRG